MQIESTPQAANVLAAASPKLARYVRGTQLLLPHGFTYKDWDDLGDWLEVARLELERNASLVRCLRADWWNYGTQTYGQTKAAQARSMYGVSALTIANDASELRRVDPDARVIDGATFSQLAAVRHAEPAAQAGIIADAVANGMPASEVERIARGVKDREEWRRGRLLAGMRNAYNELDAEGRDEWHKWYLKVRKLDG